MLSIFESFLLAVFVARLQKVGGELVNENVRGEEFFDYNLGNDSPVVTGEFSLVVLASSPLLLLLLFAAAC